MKNNHLNDSGDLHMVDISKKEITVRESKASGVITLNKDAFESIHNRSNKKGDVLNTARLAGINAIKATSSLIPLAHTIQISTASVSFSVDEHACKIISTVSVKSEGKTGVEIEALVGVQISLMTIYDMCKYLDRSMVINDIKLLSKTGGKSGAFERGE